MTVGLALILGIVQGLTEFLPVSSSGHLVLFQTLLGKNIEGGYVFFDLLLHLGTLIAVFIAFWSDIKTLILEFFSMIADGFKIKDNPDRKFIIMLIVSVLPMILILPIKDKIELLFSSPITVGIALVITGIMLYVCDRLVSGGKTAKDARYSDALAVGAIQCVAVIPGISRSGSTIFGGTLCGFSHEFAVKFAFIMSIPVILGANILSIADAAGEITNLSMLPAYGVGVIAAAVSGYFAIRLIKYIAKERKFTIFAVYCAIVGIITIIASLI